MEGTGKAKYTPESRARASAMGSLAMREHSRKELLDKLLAKNHDEAIVYSLVQQLENENLLSDQRFAESYWRSRSKKGYGPNRIRRELEFKGVGVQIIEAGLLEAEIDFILVCQQAYMKKYKGKPVDDFKENSKRKNFLYQRGFSSELIRQVIEA